MRASSTAVALLGTAAVAQARVLPAALQRSALNEKSGTRRLDDVADACATAFTACESDVGCMLCVNEVLSYDGEVDVEDDDVDPTTWSCAKTFDFLHSNGFCKSMNEHSGSAGPVCKVWTECASDEVTDDATFDDDLYTPTECDASKCDVAHPAWLGDGFCDDDEPCYNTAACGWDNGDCCASTCKDASGTFGCGSDSNFVCRDPDAQGCASLAQAQVQVQKHGATKDTPWGGDMSLYAVLGTSYVPVSQVGPEATGEESACLAAGCYVVEIEPDASFSRDPEWAIYAGSSKKDKKEGDERRVLASGSSPDVCLFTAGYEPGSEAEQAVEMFCPKMCASDAFTETTCAPSDLYMMVLRDAGYNGWNGIGYSIHKHDMDATHGAEVASGTLNFGHMGVDAVCIEEPGCYTVTLERGWWHEEVSWSLGKVNEGLVAQGGAPSSCDFSVGSDSFCEATCLSENDDDVLACDEGLVLHDVELFSTLGSGWGSATYAITAKGVESPLQTGALDFGFQSEEDVCLAAGCYDFTILDFSPGMEWALGSREAGLVLSGSTEKAAATCVFAVGAEKEDSTCVVTCTTEGSITPPPTPKSACEGEERRAVVRMSDSWSDGWDGALFSLFDAPTEPTPAVKNATQLKPLATGTLEDGAYGEYSVCVAPGCYRIDVTSGKWHDEISWDIVDETRGLDSEQIVASGVAPETCYFSMGATSLDCRLGCFSGMAPVNEDDNVYDYGSYDDDFWLDDPDPYEDDWGGDDVGQRCTTGVDCTFNNLIAGWFTAGQLTVCVATAAAAEEDASLFDPFDISVWGDRPELCLGTYDFKELDAFEACAQELETDYAAVWSSGRGDKAEECMRILLSAVPDKSEDKQSADPLVMRIATMVYYYGNGGFCDCTTQGDFAPECRDFLDFNAVLRETREACHALDQVDCAYFGEYLETCQRTLPAKFGYIDLKDEAQCDYLEVEGCGGLPIPAVRKWDCLLGDNAEMSASQRTFVESVFRDCNPSIADDDDNTVIPAKTDDDAPIEPTRSSSKKSKKDDSVSAAAVIVPILLILASFLAGYIYVAKFKPEILPSWVPNVLKSSDGGSSDSASSATELAYAFTPLGHGDEQDGRGV